MTSQQLRSNTVTKRTAFLWGLSGATLAFIGSAFLWWLFSSDGEEHDPNQDRQAQVDIQKTPLYWVAPMDDSYRRDKPGKSPMGMDLVPVYAESTSGTQGTRSPGTVMITPNVQQNMGVKTAQVEVGKLDLSVSAIATVSYDEDQIIHIHPRVEGWIDTLHIKAQGEEVSVGQPLYTLYSPELVSAQEEYVLALKRNDTRLEEGARQRLQSLGLSSDFINNLKKTRKVVQQVTFNAPQSGVVEAMTIREGFYVQPGTTIMSIAKLDKVWVLADILESHAGTVKLGDNVIVTHSSSPTAVWDGIIDYIYPSLSATTRTLKVRVPLSNPNGVLKPNMFAKVKIVPQHVAPSLLVPKSAVIQTHDQARVVLTDTQGNFKSVNIQTGRQDAHYYEVTRGLLPGDEVVTSAQFLIDSESSKASDFNRMEAPDHQATTWGKIENITLHTQDNAGLAMMTIARGPIEKWGRGPATMDFVLSPHIMPSQFKVGDKVVFTFVTGDEFTVIDMRHSSHEEDASHMEKPPQSSSKGDSHHTMDMHHD